MSAPPKPAKPPKRPRYWKGHVTVEGDFAKIRELLDLSREGECRDGWWRYYAINKIEGPLERVLLARERGEYYPFKTRWTSRHPRGRRLCTCGLIVPAHDTPKHAFSCGSSASVLEPCWPDDPAQRAQVEAEFLAAPGHNNRGHVSGTHSAHLPRTRVAQGENNQCPKNSSRNLVSTRRRPLREQMMISDLYLRNFQGFRDEVHVPLKPLTLIFGKNAAGKSSILRSILVAKQSLTVTARQDSRFRNGFVYEGSDVALASYRNVVFKHDENLKLELGLGVTSMSRVGPVRFRRLQLSGVKARFQVQSNSQLRSLILTMTSSVDGEVDLLFESETAGTAVLEKISNPTALANMLTNVQFERVGSPSPLEEVPSTGGFDFEFGETEIESLIGSKYQTLLNFPRNAYRASEIQDLVEEDVDSIDFQARARFVHLLNFAAGQVGAALSHTDNIGPLRQISDRLIYEGGEVFNETPADGEEEKENQASTIDAVQKWLLDLTGNRFRFETRQLHASGAEFLGSFRAPVVVDTTTNTPVSFSDVGVGLSQVIPILERLEFAIRRKLIGGRTLLIEQPELHLHPAMQSDLCDLFINVIGDNPGVQIIAETHSEQMLLRVQRRLRDGTLNPESVQILYVDALGDDSSNHVVALPFNNERDFEVTLPTSFSGLRMNEFN